MVDEDEGDGGVWWGMKLVHMTEEWWWIQGYAHRLHNRCGALYMCDTSYVIGDCDTSYVIGVMCVFFFKLFLYNIVYNLIV